MMKVYINIKRNSNLRLHQPFNKRIGLMKRGKTYRTLHHFSFGERFDETMMNAYHFGYQYIILSPHQFIGFSSANKSIEQTDGRKCHYPQAGRTSDLLAVRPADKGRRIISMKRKGPNEPTGLHPSGHPRLPRAARPQADGYRQTICRTKKTRNKHGIHKHPNQQGERVG